MQFADLVGLTADPAFVIGAGQELLAANEAAAALVGEPAERIAGRPCSEVIAALHPGGERLCAFGCPVYQVMAGGKPVALGWSTWATPDGRLLPISGTVVAAPAGDAPQHEVALIIVHVGDAPAAEPPALEVRLLGTTTLRVHGARVPLPRRRRAIELLAYLAVAGGRGAHRDQLLDDFWPDVPPGDSAPRLRVLVHALRQLLGSAGLEHALERRGDRYVLDTHELRIDALDFQVRAHAILRTDVASTEAAAVELALGMYQGDLGAGESFGAWAVPESERLRRMYHDLLRRAAQYFAQCGAIDRSVECCEIALRSDPLQEQFQIALIAYYGHLGRREDAVRQYEDYRRILAAEAGEEPTPATVRALDRALHPVST